MNMGIFDKIFGKSNIRRGNEYYRQARSIYERGEKRLTKEGEIFCYFWAHQTIQIAQNIRSMLIIQHFKIRDQIRWCITFCHSLLISIYQVTQVGFKVQKKYAYRKNKKSSNEKQRWVTPDLQ